MAKRIRRGLDADIAAVRNALQPYQLKHPASQIDIHRQNSVSIRIRIIDPDFEGKSLVRRDSRLWKYLDELPDEVRSQITFLLLLTPKETKTSFANMDFEDPIPSNL